MNSHLKFIIQLILVDYNEILQDEILLDLKKIFFQHYKTKVLIDFRDSEKYEKFDNHTKCFFNVYCEKDCDVRVKSIINFLNKDEWDYSFVFAHNINDSLKGNVNLESAVWSKNDSDIVLLNENVVWIHIYTWDAP